MKIGFQWTAVVCALAFVCLAGVAAAQEDTGSATDGTTIVDDIEPYDGPIGPGSPLYGLKIAFEDLDESFTFNETELLNKQVEHARMRLSEARGELLSNNTGAADIALQRYWQEINMTQERLHQFDASGNTGLLNAQQMVVKHQFVLENLIESRPDNPGLVRAYDNSVALQQQFEQKTQVRFERVAEKNNAPVINMKGVRLEVSELQPANTTGSGKEIRVQQVQLVQQQGTGTVQQVQQVRKEQDGQQQDQNTGNSQQVQQERQPDRVNKAPSDRDNNTGSNVVTPSPVSQPGTIAKAVPQNGGSVHNGNDNTGNTSGNNGGGTGTSTAPVQGSGGNR